MQPIYEGKAKRLYETENPNELLMEFKDDATAFNGEKHAVISNKGPLNKRLTVLLYQMLEQKGITTHFVSDGKDDRHMIVRRSEIIPLEVVVRNYIAGSLQKRTGLVEGRKLKQPLVEFYYKDDDLGDPLLTQDHIRELDLASNDELVKLKRQALRLNEVMVPFWANCGIQLVDFKVEFGRLFPDKKNIVLADEISPDTCRLWDMETGEKLDKDRFRYDLGDLETGYQKVLKAAEDALRS